MLDHAGQLLEAHGVVVGLVGALLWGSVAAAALLADRHRIVRPATGRWRLGVRRRAS